MTFFAYTYSGNRPQPRLDLSRDEYDELLHAREIDFSQLVIENKYQILIDNYGELEKELLCFSLDWAIRTPEPWDALRDAHTLFDRRVLNFLSSARMYLDQIPGDLGTASRQPELAKEKFQKSASMQYDSSLPYRVCEALRNYTQHKDLPVHGVSHGSRREQDDIKNITINYSGLTLDIAKLESDGKFKSTVLEELRKENNKHDLKSYLRQYMHSLGLIHLELRTSLSGDGEWAINLIRQVIAKVKALPAVDPRSYVFLAIGAEDDRFEIKGRINTDRFNRRKLLEARTSIAPRLTQVHLSSE